jgi:uncharacterized sulfatase
MNYDVKHTVLKTALSLFAMGSGICAFADESPTGPLPNIVLILLDDVGTGWIPPYADRLTPDDMDPEILASYENERNGGRPLDMMKHIDAAQTCMPFLSSLAEDGAVFDRCFATAGLCAPSRAGLMTGTFQQRWGVYGNLDMVLYGVPEERSILVEPLKSAGYETAMIGKWHIAKNDPSIPEQVWREQGGAGPLPMDKLRELVGAKSVRVDRAYRSSSMSGQHPLDRGFDYYFGYNSHADEFYNSTTLWENHERVPPRPDGEFLTDLLNRKSCEFVESALSRKKPFFLYYSPMTAHGELKDPPDHYFPPFDTGIHFSDGFAAHLYALDHGIQKIFQTLEKYGQAENTLFVFTSDNGCDIYSVPPYNSPNRGGKGTGWLGAASVPLVVCQPGVVKPAVYRDLISLADVMPTILDAAGVSLPEGIDGCSFLPFLRGDVQKGPRSELYSCGLHSTLWCYFYEGKGAKAPSDRGMNCPFYAWKLENDQLLLQVTPVSSNYCSALPNGLPFRTRFYDLSVDPLQRTDLHGKFPEQEQSFTSDIQKWLSTMAEPKFSAEDREKYNMLRAGSPIHERDEVSE